MGAMEDAHHFEQERDAFKRIADANERALNALNEIMEKVCRLIDLGQYEKAKAALVEATAINKSGDVKNNNREHW